MEITVAVIKEKSGAFSLKKVELDGPGANEVKVKITTCGICQTYLAFKDQVYSAPLPILKSHEGFGVIEDVGIRVTKVKPGDHVVISFLQSGKCTTCLKNSPYYCYKIFGLNFVGSQAYRSHIDDHGNKGLHDFF